MTTATIKLTQKEQLLLTAHDLEESGHRPFTTEELVCAAWDRSPMDFGLGEHHRLEHPSDNRIIVHLSGPKGMVGRGLFVKDGQNKFSLSRAGRLEVRRLLGADLHEPEIHKGNGHDPQETLRYRLTPSEEQRVLELLDSMAVEKHQRGLQVELVSAHAFRFWGVSVETPHLEINDHLRELREFLALLKVSVEENGDITLRNGMDIGTQQVALLQRVDLELRTRFSRQREMLINRRR